MEFQIRQQSFNTPAIHLPSRQYLIKIIVNSMSVGLCAGFAAAKSLEKVIENQGRIFPKTLWIGSDSALILQNLADDDLTRDDWQISEKVQIVQYSWTDLGIVLANTRSVLSLPDRYSPQLPAFSIEDPFVFEQAERLRAPTLTEANQLIDAFGVSAVAEYIANAIGMHSLRQNGSSWTDVDLIVQSPYSSALLALEVKQSHATRTNLHVPWEQFQRLSRLSSWFNTEVRSAYVWQIRNRGTYSFDLSLPNTFSSSRLVSALVDGHSSTTGRPTWADDHFEDGKRSKVIPLGITEEHGLARNFRLKDLLDQPELFGLHRLDRYRAEED